MIKKLSMCFVSLTLASCATFIPPQPNDPSFAPRYPTVPKPPVQNTGSLFKVSNNSLLFEDTKANQVGDIITVVLTESTDARKTADTELTKETSVALPNPTIAGRQITFDNGTKSFELGVQGDLEFRGESDSEQSNQLNGTISVTVHEVLPNGNLYVRGEKWLTLNQGDEFIRISGILRPKDISAQNTVPSNRMANARIQYSGTGPIAESNTPGWLTRFFNSPWWPF